MITKAQARVLEAASVGQLGYVDRLNKPSYFYDNRQGGGKFNKKACDPIRKYIYRIQYTPVLWLYGLNAIGKIVYREYLDSLK